ncbi:alpha/beta fold hydrolase [Pseudonocardia sp. RS010]|uniref:alpha/beta fold hydrolase n=1 Tax=Pseudonocardia sp. RS010 TaxID=3385979 RepID=UPI0039A12224
MLARPTEGKRRVRRADGYVLAVYARLYNRHCTASDARTTLRHLYPELQRRRTTGILTDDRRGNSRSPRPPGWDAAPMDEQADDAAALLTALDLAPAVAHGNSSGAMILTSLSLRRPEVLRAAIFHEPPFAAVTSGGAAAGRNCSRSSSRGWPRAARRWPRRSSSAGSPGTRRSSRSTTTCARGCWATATGSSVSSSRTS